ncbi:calcium-binding protein [Nannocystis pusilla]|uniref:Calcium-binding protein n=1 Tax=Nannocystis pusilla TaxID=889268 RepID=A0ABS7U104_9BACT|nr:calcium-binding protein [Nannocystis pusilla]MBZ5714129.1 calcium-binding protein [Nannocystis pusilla]
MSRLLALSTLSLALSACDPQILPGDHGSQRDDFGREGEACAADRPSAACQVESVAGVEYCVYSPVQVTYVWSACLTETCEEEGETRPCEEGLQHCVGYEAERNRVELRWGACVEEDECTPGESRSCGLDEGIDMGCVADENGRGVWDIEDCNTPLVLSFGEPIEFAPASVAAADFDIRGGAGSCARADWPSAATPWLALDRDGNGSIDGGRELFGSATRMSSGTGPHNGFDALAELDSDRDGKLTAADARWGELVLWADHDGDRRSTGWETLPLASFEIVEIDLGYTTRRECDARGNCGLERARFVYRSMGQERSGEVVDVRVQCE